MQAYLEPRILDVRPLLALGVDPFSVIAEAKQALQPGQGLILRAPFEPFPLYELFQAEGYEVRATQHAPDNWEIHFTPGGDTQAEVREMDLRSIEPSTLPEKALEGVQALHREQSLVLHTGFRPVRLFERLDPQTTDYDCEETDSGHWVTTIWRISG
ncbi:MAG: DUF2249 domain-containing protein [Verrucomicrobia bacterium]|jgi:uncharacterized protein (DUF2249 family)|nr:DUF2249 domain-containing protein [Verrucomicrobiota bacterium]